MLFFKVLLFFYLLKRCTFLLFLLSTCSRFSLFSNNTPNIIQYLTLCPSPPLIPFSCSTVFLFILHSVPPSQSLPLHILFPSLFQQSFHFFALLCILFLHHQFFSLSPPTVLLFLTTNFEFSSSPHLVPFSLRATVLSGFFIIWLTVNSPFQVHK